MRPAGERVEASKIIQKVSRKDNGISMGCGETWQEITEAEKDK